MPFPDGHRDHAFPNNAGTHPYVCVGGVGGRGRRQSRVLHHAFSAVRLLTTHACMHPERIGRDKTAFRRIDIPWLPWQSFLLPTLLKGLAPNQNVPFRLYVQVVDNIILSTEITINHPHRVRGGGGGGGGGGTITLKYFMPLVRVSFYI